MTPEERQLSDDWKAYNDLYRKAQRMCRSGHREQRLKGQQIFANLPTLRDALKKRGQQLKSAKSANGAAFSTWWESTPDARRRSRNHRKLKS